MQASRCLSCGSELAAGQLADQCPNCLGRLAFGEFAEPTPDLLRRIGDYDFLRELGRGGMGIVYEARQRSLNRRVAVKMLLTGVLARPELKPRFRAEAEAVAQLHHPGIVTIYEVGELDGQPFFAMEIIAGSSLEELVRSQPLPPKTAARYMRQVTEAIAHAHSAGILHRDLKPSNVLLDQNDQPKVTDFGLAKLLDSDANLTRNGEIIGSPNYLSPEQARGTALGVWSDVYSLGAVLYQLLTARPPFAAASLEATLRQVIHDEPVSPRLLNGSTPPELANICLKCLEKEPERRYARATELAEDLARFEAGEPVRARPVSLLGRLRLWSRRNPTLALVSAGLVLAVVTGIASVVIQWRRAEASRTEMAQNLYAADVAEASTALEKGDLGHARELLLRHADLPLAMGKESPNSQLEFTWRLLWNRCQGQELATLGFHPWIVTCLAVSPDGNWAASGSQHQPNDQTNSLKIWALGNFVSRLPPNSGFPVTTLASTNTIWSVAFTHDSATLVAAGVNGIGFWNVTNGARRPEFAAPRAQEFALAGDQLVGSPNHPFFNSSAPEPLWHMNLATREVRHLAARGRHPAVSPDGRQLAYLDGDVNIQLIDLATERRLSTVATNRLVFRLRFSPDGQRLVSAGQSTSARIWNLAVPSSRPLAFQSEHNLWDAAFTPDGKTLITSTSHQQLELWNALTAEPRRSLAGHDNEVWAVAPLPDGKHVLSGSKDRTVRLWSLEEPAPVPSIGHWRYAKPAFSPDGTRLLTYPRVNGRGRTAVWKLPAPVAGGGQRVLNPTLDHPSPASPSSNSLATLLGIAGPYPRGFAPDGTSVLFLQPGPPRLEWWDIETAKTVRTVLLAQSPTNLLLNEYTLAGDARSFVCLDEAGAVWRWSTEDGRVLNYWSIAALAKHLRAEIAGGKRPDRVVRCLALSPTGRWLAVGTFSDVAGLLIDCTSGRTVELIGHRDDIAQFVFARRSDLLASGSVDGTIRLWEVATGHRAGEFSGHFEAISALEFSPDGRTLVSVNEGIDVSFWHVATRRKIAHLAYPEAGYTLAFSPEGNRLAVGTTVGNLETETDRVEIWEAPVPSVPKTPETVRRALTSGQ